MPAPLTTVLTFVVGFDGLGFGLGILLPLYYAFTRRVLPTVGGIRLLDGGPFAKLEMDALLVVGLVFVIISGLKLMAAYWLWNSRLDGAALELILLALSAIFWYGFALPFGPPIGLAQVVLLVLVWSTLH